MDIKNYNLQLFNTSLFSGRFIFIGIDLDDIKDIKEKQDDANIKNNEGEKDDTNEPNLVEIKPTKNKIGNLIYKFSVVIKKILHRLNQK